MQRSDVLRAVMEMAHQLYVGLTRAPDRASRFKHAPLGRTPRPDRLGDHICGSFAGITAK
jgi:hypothetical protein